MSNSSKLLDNKIVKGILSVSREFIMIIVGIFIALQVDGWVKDRTEISELNMDLNYVTEDLINNKKALQDIKTVKEKSIHNCTEMIDHYHQSKSMTPEDIVHTLSGILTTNNFEIDKSGFSRVESSPLYESTEFFPVRDKIREYNSVLGDVRFSENFINSYISLLSLEMSKNGKLLSVFNYLRMKNGIAHYKAAPPKFGLDEILTNNKPLQAVLHKYEIDAPTLFDNYDKLLKTGEELDKTIEKYLK